MNLNSSLSNARYSVGFGESVKCRRLNVECSLVSRCANNNNNNWCVWYARSQQLPTKHSTLLCRNKSKRIYFSSASRALNYIFVYVCEWNANQFLSFFFHVEPIRPWHNTHNVSHLMPCLSCAVVHSVVSKCLIGGSNEINFMPKTIAPQPGVYRLHFRCILSSASIVFISSWIFTSRRARARERHKRNTKFHALLCWLVDCWMHAKQIHRSTGSKRFSFTSLSASNTFIIESMTAITFCCCYIIIIICLGRPSTTIAIRTDTSSFHSSSAESK